MNDVAEVNIDQKLIAGQTVASSKEEGVTKNNCPAGIVQLANGCACCSLSEELLLSVSERKYSSFLVSGCRLNKHIN